REPTETAGEVHVAGLARAEIVVAVAGRANRTAGGLRNHGRQVRVAQFRLQDLHIAHIGAAVGPNLAGRPGWCGELVGGVVASGDVPGERGVVAFGCVPAARVLHGHDVTLAGEMARDTFGI